jgi:hypothetical protein
MMLAAFLAGTLRDSRRTRTTHRYERKINIQYRGLLAPANLFYTSYGKVTILVIYYLGEQMLDFLKECLIFSKKCLSV